MRNETTEERNRRLKKEAWINLQSEYKGRVATHPATDAWMRGDRFGTVEKIGRRNLRIYVRLDSGRLQSFLPHNLETRV